jgi:hypothetical protein
VYFYDDEGKLRSLLTGWTSVSPADPFVVVAAGRSPFRLADLLELSRLVGAMAAEEGRGTHSEEERRV